MNGLLIHTHTIFKKGGDFFMIMVKKEKGESDDKLISRFRKKVVNSGVLFEYRDRERFKSASERRKEKKYRVAHMIEIDKSRE